MSLLTLAHKHILHTEICAIVNPLSSGNMLAREFRKKKYRCVYVQSTPEPIPVHGTSHRPQDFIGTVIHKGDFDRTLKEVAAFQPKMLLNGFEVGVEFGDLLSERLGLPSNGTALSPARRDKCLMSEAVRKSGLRTIPQEKFSELPALLKWITNRAAYPVVLKPPTSAGSDGVTLCRNEAEVTEAFARLLGRKNRLSSTVDREIIAEPRMIGTEFIVDTVSYDGVTRLVDIWRTVKTPANGRDFIYDYLDLYPSTGEAAKPLRDFARGVCNALGIQYGPAHHEFILDKDGPLLVEVGARLCGGQSPHIMVKHCTGTNQVEWTCEAFTDPTDFKQQADGMFEAKTRARLIQLISTEAGTVKAIPGLAEVQKLKSFFRFFTGVHEGSLLEKTVDLYSCPADVALVHDDPDQLEADYRRVREIEAKGFFDV